MHKLGKVIGWFIVVLTFFFIVGKLFSQNSFMVTPVIYEIETQPEQKEIYKLNIINSSSTGGRIKVNLYLLDFCLTEDGEVVFYPPGTLKRSASRWIKLDHSQIVVNSEERKDVPITLNIPSDSEGGYYAAIVVEQVPEEAVNDKLNVVSWRMVSFLVLVVKGLQRLQRKITIESIIVEPLKEKGQLIFIITLKNEGNVHVRIQGTLVVEDKKGKEIEKFPLTVGERIIFPESIRKFTIITKEVLPPGDYLAKIVVNYTDKKRIMAELPFMIREKGEPMAQDKLFIHPTD